MHISNASNAIKVVSSDNVTVSNNVIIDNINGVIVDNNDGNRSRVNPIINNEIRNNDVGIRAISTGVDIQGNIVVNNQAYGIDLTGGLVVEALLVGGKVRLKII